MGNEYPMTNVGAIIIARDQSKRCPHKALADILGKPALYRMVERIKQSNFITNVIIATSEDSPDIIDFCKNYNIHCTVGDINDVLSRTYKAANEFEVGTIVRLWGDCIMIDPYVVNDVINNHFAYYSDYTYNTGFPKGLNCHVLDFEILKEAHKNFSKPIDRMFFARIIMKDCKTREYSYYKNLESINLCVDYPEDLEFTRYVYSKLYNPERAFKWEQIIPLWEEKYAVLR